jgi:hypothetical protein
MHCLQNNNPVRVSHHKTKQKQNKNKTKTKHPLHSSLFVFFIEKFEIMMRRQETPR